MSSSDTDSENYTTDDSDYNFISGYEIEVEPEITENEHHVDQTIDQVGDGGLDVAGPYSDEPIADVEWLAEYERQQEEEEVIRQELQHRFDESEPATNWCSCGHCSIELLQNVYECRCCNEIEQCVEYLSSDRVLEEVQVAPPCITLHPGFRPVCLERWALRQSAGKFKTKDKKRYRQNGSEEAFLRSISYREFSQLVYGYLGKERNPLPACAYHSIRRKFKEEGESFNGFEYDEDL